VWLTTVTPSGAPLPQPVGFLWDGDDVIWVYRQSGAGARNIARNPNVTLNFDSDGRGGDIVVLSGTANIDASAPSAAENTAWVAKVRRRVGTLGHDDPIVRAAFQRPRQDSC
jgi:PPOX class probable F420-dependent enzyme